MLIKQLNLTGRKCLLISIRKLCDYVMYALYMFKFNKVNKYNRYILIELANKPYYKQRHKGNIYL